MEKYKYMHAAVILTREVFQQQGFETKNINK